MFRRAKSLTCLAGVSMSTNYSNMSKYSQDDILLLPKSWEIKETPEIPILLSIASILWQLEALGWR